MGCARNVLEAVPPLMWFLRRNMHRHRGGVSLPQFRVLVRVYREPATNLSAVAEHVGVSLPAASRMAAALERKGLLSRGGSVGDRRQMELSLTDRGRQVLLDAWAAAQVRLAEELGRLDENERDAVEKGMRILQGVFGALGLPEDLGAPAGPGGARPAERPEDAPRHGT